MEIWNLTNGCCTFSAVAVGGIPSSPIIVREGLNHLQNVKKKQLKMWRLVEKQLLLITCYTLCMFKKRYTFGN